MLTGLRGRLAALLAVVCAVALGICALALLPPLDQRLRDDEIEALVQQARADIPTLRPAAGKPPHASAALNRAVRAVRRRGGAAVAVISSTGAVLAANDRDPEERYPEAVLALRRHHTVRATIGSGAEAEALVAVPTRAGFAVAVRKPLDDARAAAAVVRHAFVVAAAISLPIALLLGMLLAGRVARRLRRLRDTALRVAQLGPLAEFRADPARDEVGDLTRAFATMQEHLREQEGARRSFVATASHELRTPLTSLRLVLDVARGDLEGEPDVVRVREHIERADVQAERLATLAGDLLDLSRLDAGIPLRSELLELTELVRSVVAEFEIRAAEGERVVELDLSPPRWTLADPGSTAQVVRILVDNAVRHADGAIRIRLGEQRGMAAVSVQDAGSGISAADRERVFARFERGASAHPGPGFGLGLAIGRELAERMDGTLELDPDGGTGARFVLLLPAASAP